MCRFLGGVSTLNLELISLVSVHIVLLCRTEILVLLERRKKGVKKDGLYKFVLWREALKDEKNKLTA